MVNLTMGNPYATTHVTAPSILASMNRTNIRLLACPA